MFNKIYNKKLIKYYNNEEDFEKVEYKKLVKAKDGNMYMIDHFKFPDNYDVLSKGGKIYVFNNRKRIVGLLKYMYKPGTDSLPSHMFLWDIEMKIKNIGLGSIVIEIFEKCAVDCGAHFITGELSSIDERSEENKQLRDAFYIKHGYTIQDGKILKELI